MATVLRRRSKGAAVRDLQGLLNLAGASPSLIVDGDFGPATDRALRAFQSRAGLVVDGAYGPQSRAALRQVTTPAKKPTRAEPDKSAMTVPVTDAPPVSSRAPAPPPNAAALKLLATARFIDEIVIHCAATPEGRDFTIEDIRQWHKARGWADGGYHYVAYRDGRALALRPVGQIGAGVAGHNTGKIHIAYIGGVTADGKTPKDTRTDAQISTLLWLTAELARLHKVKRVRGHNDFTNAKACPSFRVGADPLGAIAS